jgi:S-adenosyl-L-methionine hydrolase (adenosine-forming)
MAAVMSTTRPIFLITDLGPAGHYAGQLRAVISSIAPAAPIHDLAHGIEPWAVDEGAWLLETALPVLPPSAIVLAVVDPGVGTHRREMLVASDGRLFVGPDNGLLSAAFPPGVRAGGGALGADARELCSPQFRRPHVSATFHGRDIFAPAAAHLANGLDYRLLGPPIADPVLLPPFEGQPGPLGELHGRVVHIDRFGNLITTIRAAQLFPAFEISVGTALVDCRVNTFGTAPRDVPFCHVDSSGFIAIAINQASAALALGVQRAAPVVVRAR